MSHLKEKSPFLTTLWVLLTSPHWFFKPDVFGLVSVVQMPTVGVPDMGH